MWLVVSDPTAKVTPWNMVSNMMDGRHCTFQEHSLDVEEEKLRGKVERRVYEVTKGKLYLA